MCVPVSVNQNVCLLRVLAIAVTVRLPSDGATGEKLAAAASKVQRKLAKLEGNIAESARTVAALAGDPRIPQQVRAVRAARSLGAVGRRSYA